MPGTGGADTDDALELEAPFELNFDPEPTAPPPPKAGALLSLVSAFFSLAPFLISPSNASRPCIIDAAGFAGFAAPGALGPAPEGGGGGGGGGGGTMMIDRTWDYRAFGILITYEP